ncbi:DUF4124 domain-containing protein [Spongiibacter sp.]|uniref:DUF4124 domain-containing protein n=1 Tax=Spongiibacter sp. TaxID=2024860 RepID=UPI0035630F21
MITRFLLTSCLSLGLLTASADLLAAKAGYYRWTDAEGEVHFSQKPPVGKPYEFIETQTGIRSKADDSPAVVTSDTAEDNRASELDADAKMEVLPPKDPELCKKARGNMQSLKISGARIKVTDKNGQTRYLSPDEIATQKLRAQDAIKIHCE